MTRRTWSAGGRHLGGLLPCVMMGAAVGCYPLDVTDGVEARVRIQAEEGVGFMFLTSTDFVVGASPSGDGGALNVQVLHADTASSEASVETTHDISATRRFFVQAFFAEPEGSQVRLTVWIDGSERYDRISADLHEEPLEFTFVRGGN